MIDWFTVVAQALNFLILVWLMKRFLYKPIRHAIDVREKRIAAELAAAATAQRDAESERAELGRKTDALEQQRAALLQKATDDATAEGQRLIDGARTAADELSAKRAESLMREAAYLNQAILLRAQDEVFAIARKTLTDLAAASLEARICEVFTRRLRALDGAAKQVLAEALGKVTEAALVRSAFDLPEEQRAAVQRAVNETFSADVPLRFETAPDVVSGIELTAHGQKLAWSIADYLGAMEKGVAQLVATKPGREPAAPEPAAATEASAA